ncbi:MAG: hypothetical protein EBY48_00605 [Opitutae bacterium]|nr:hypothetical protein [Opitutae bacterium]
MKVHLVQFSPLWEDKEANFARVEHLIESSSPEPHSLVVLPEAFATGFSLNLQVTCGGEPEQTHAFLSRLSSTHKVWIMAGCISPDPSGALGRNLAVLFDPAGRYIGEYQKMYPFTPMGEDKKHMAGQEPKLFNIKDFRLCPLLCYDLRFPELFRTSVKKGANLFVVLASWPDSRMSHWHALLLARAIENQAYVISCSAGYPGRFSLVKKAQSVAQSDLGRLILATIRSILLSSSVVNSIFFTALRLSLICSVVLAPISALVTLSLLRTQARAIWAKV